MWPLHQARRQGPLTHPAVLEVSHGGQRTLGLVDYLAATLIGVVVVLGIYGRLLEYRDQLRRLEKQRRRRSQLIDGS